MRPPLACKNCRARKKRCDRKLPICTLCLRAGRRCSYRVGNVSNARPTFQNPLVGEIVSRDLITPSLFLDNVIINPLDCDARLQPFVVGPVLRDWLSMDTDSFSGLGSSAAIFDVWLPFIRWKNLLPKAEGSTEELLGDEVLLLACVKLLAAYPVSENPRTTHYLSIKSEFLRGESEGHISLRLVQAQLVLHLYEFGHAIYPSAYLSLGACIRYLASLGVNSSCLGPGEDDIWMEGEIRRRLWWATYAMERVTALNCPRLPLWMEDPKMNARLPSDDKSWQQEAPTADADLTIEALASRSMGNFRLLALTSHLVSQVILHENDRIAENGDGSCESKRVQLYRSVCALMAALEIEDKTARLAVGLPRSLLNSAIFVLHMGERPADVTIAQTPLSIAAESFLQRARAFLHGELSPLNRISPFLLHWGFQSFRLFYYRHRQYRRPEDFEALKDLGIVFTVMEQRWKLAGVYMSLLNASQHE